MGDLKTDTPTSSGIGINLSEDLNTGFFKDCAGEAVGTALLLYLTATAVTSGGVASAIDTAWVFGASMLVLTYAFAGISGGHLNPAVSFGHMVNKNITAMRCIGYTASQCAGAVLGTAFAKSLDSDSDVATWNAVTDGTGTGTAFGAEVMGTFALVFVVMSAADQARSSKSAHLGTLAPLAIGMSYFVLQLGMQGIDGCSINPARSFGPSIVNGEWDNHWVFWAGPLVGGVLGSTVYELFFKGN